MRRFSWGICALFCYLPSVGSGQVATGTIVGVVEDAVDGYFNLAAFSEPVQAPAANGAPIPLFGDAARRVGRGPGSVNFDVSLFKNFQILERLRAQFRAG